MVYCGKPSKACESCRSRRIRCDLRRPACTQCTKISKTCSGYRDQLDLFFRDESASVVRKINKKRKTQEQDTWSRSSEEAPRFSQTPPQLSDGYSPLSVDGDTLSIEMTNMLSVWTPTFQIEDVAQSHFMESYILGSHFDYLPELIRNTMGDGPLSSAINANACANFYRETGQPDLLVKARDHYIQALTKTKTAIDSPLESLQESTVASILLLGLFETLTQDYRHNPESYATHLNGAVSLLNLRGRDLFNTKLGTRIFMQVSMNLRVSCAQREIELPSDFREIDEISQPFLNTFDPTVQFFALIDAFQQLRAKARRDHASGTLTTESVETALRYDQMIAKLLEDTPPELGYTKVHIDCDDAFVLGREFYQFANHRIAQRWNAMRMLRLLFNEHAWEVMNYVSVRRDPSNTSTFLIQELTRRTAVEMARDICASVPQFCQHGPSGLLPVTPALFLLWPLALAGHCCLSPPDVKEYAVRSLRYLGEEARLPQGVWASEMVAEGEQMEDWLYLSHIA